MTKRRQAEIERLAVWGLGVLALYKVFGKCETLVGQTDETGKNKDIAKELDYIRVRNIVLNEMGNIEYLQEFFERFKKEYPDITFDPKEWIKNKDGDVVRKK